MCTIYASHQELYVTLYDYISTGRRALATRTASGVGGQTIRASPKFHCNHAVNPRQYETEADGYSIVGGVWYAASQRDFATFTCPYQVTDDVPTPWDGSVSRVLVRSEPTAGRRFAVGRLDNGLVVLD